MAIHEAVGLWRKPLIHGKVRILEYAKEETTEKASVQALFRQAKIERMSRHVGLFAIGIVVVLVVASIASPFFRPALWY